MATVYITEYQKYSTSGTMFQAALEPENASQTVALTGTSTVSAAFNKNTYLIRVHTDAICTIEVGATPVATTSGTANGSKRMAANQTEYFAVTPGLKLAAITAS